MRRTSGMSPVSDLLLLLLLCCHLLPSFSSSSKILEMPPGHTNRLTLSPNDRTVKKFIGDTYVVSCINGASDTQWFNAHGDRIPNDSNAKNLRPRQSLRRGGGGIDLFLQKVTLDDAGLYTCRSKATNVTFNFVVIKPISFTPSFSHQTAPDASPSFTIKCSATGHSPASPKLYWKVDGRSPQGPKFKVVKDGLVIHNVTKADGKRSYVCHAMDIDSPMPDVKSMSIVLSVKRAPAVVSGGVTEKWAAIGSYVNFTCTVSDPDDGDAPTFSWFDTGSQPIPTTDSSEHFQIISNYSSSSTLIVRPTHTSHFGPYVCRSSNQVGSVEKTFILRKSVKPSTPFLELDRVAPQNAKIRVLKYKPLPGEESVLMNMEESNFNELKITDYQVETRLAQDGAAFYPGKFTVDGQGFTLTHLLPSTSYQVRAALKNALGIGNFSPPIQITTTETGVGTARVTPVLEDEPQRIKPPPPPPPQLTDDCPPSLFQCKSGECLSYAGKCNGIAECRDASDEDGYMCRTPFLSSPSSLQPTLPFSKNILETSELSPSASRSVAHSIISQAPIKKSPLYATPARRLFYINGPNSFNSIGQKQEQQKVDIIPEEFLQKSGESLGEIFSTEEQVSSAPQKTSTNSTTIEISQNNNTQTKKTINTVTNLTKSVALINRNKITTTKKEIVVVEMEEEL